MKNNRIAYIELSLAMIIVGSSVVVGKILTNSFPVFLASGIRFGIASVILIPVLLIVEKRLQIPRKKDILILLLQSFTGLFGFSLFLLYGLKFTSASDSGIITSTTPAVIGIIAFLFLHEKITINKTLGILFAMSGIIAINILAKTNDLKGNSNIILGNFLVFGAVIGEALFTIFGKILSHRMSPLTISTYVTVLGFIMFLPFSIYEANGFKFKEVSINGWISLLYYGVIVTVIGFLLWYRGVSKVDVSTSAVFTGVLPISTLVLSFLILGEKIQISHLIGIVLVITGICISEIKKK